MTATVLNLLPQPQALECSECGATAVAPCHCGVSYVPAGMRAAKAIAANPEKSNRALATETGISEATIRRARPAASCDAPETRVGQDGKNYPATASKSAAPADGNEIAEFKPRGMTQKRMRGIFTRTISQVFNNCELVEDSLGEIATLRLSDEQKDAKQKFKDAMRILENCVALVEKAPAP